MMKNQIVKASVNGKNVYADPNTRYFYYVYSEQCEKTGLGEYRHFRTIKAAKQFIKENPTF